MIASLPMYDRRETAAANDRLWAAIRARLRAGPDALTRSGDVWDHWLDPALVLSQTCGYPYRSKLIGKVSMVATPNYDIDCPPGHYFSAIVVRADDPRETLKDYADTRFAYNEALSQSGWAAPQTHAAAHGFTFSNPIASGGHRTSAQMVARGNADIAGLDAVTWKLIQRWDDFAKDLRVLDVTEPTPGLPFITSLGTKAGPIRMAIAAAFGDVSADDLETLCLLPELDVFQDAQYLAVPTPPSRQIPLDHL